MLFNLAVRYCCAILLCVQSVLAFWPSPSPPPPNLPTHLSNGCASPTAGCDLLEQFAGQFDLQTEDAHIPSGTASSTARTRSVEHAKAGDFVRGIPLAQYTLWQEPHDPQNWNNYGLMTRDRALQLQHTQPPAAKRLLRESIAAFDLALLLRKGGRDDTSTAGARRYTEHMLQRIFPGVCRAERCKHSQLLDQAMKLLEQNSIQAVQRLCGGGDGGAAVTVPLTDKEAKCGIFSAQTAKTVYTTFRVCGVVKFAGVVDKHLVERMAQHDTVNGFEPAAVKEGIGQAPRGTDRYEVRVPLRSPFTDAVSSLAVLVASKLVMESRKIEVDTLSHVTSTPGAPMQHWHADVSHLFTSATPQLAPHGLVVVIPLVPLLPEAGPTEYCLGSHLAMPLEQSDFWHQCDDESRRPTKTAVIAAAVGDAVLFDLRIRHRGGKNSMQMRRPILYVGIVLDWYHDTVNFKQRQTNDWDHFKRPGLGLHKLYKRLDQADYVRQLEELVRQSPGGEARLGLLRSKTEGRYKEVDLVV